jgi:hypothetical protein
MWGQCAACLQRSQPNHHATNHPTGPTDNSSPQVASKKAGSEAWGDLEQGSGYSSEAGMGLAELSNFVLRKGLANMGRWGAHM